MFSDLILRNSKRSRKENGLFFSSLVISIVAFYLILSLSKQDVMIFLQKMESDAVNKLLILVPVFTEILNQIFSARPEAQLDGTPIFLTGDLQTTNLVTDRSITLSFALILPDDAFFHHTAGDYDAYINGVLDEDFVQEMGLMNAISEINNQLDRADLNNRKISYESYLQNMGRSLFYMVAASYITIYLAIIFMVVANTILGVQFLMSQRKSGRRYQTLVRLGADYSVLRKSGRSQVQWFMGLPVAVAALSSLLGVKAIVGGALAGRVGESPNTILLVSAAMILLLLVVEYIYITVVKRSSDRYLLTLMQPQREE